MDQLTVICTSARKVELRANALPSPGGGEVLVETLVSAISAGSEMLVYRGEFPQDLEDLHDKISSQLGYPQPLGYACVGRVTDLGHGVERSLLGRLVFSFQPHSTHFLAQHDSLLLVPEGITPQNAIFLPNMETAVNLVQDARPLLGERALVLGQGVVGLLVTSLLSEFPLEALVAADKYAKRREASPAAVTLDPTDADFHEKARLQLGEGADLVLELSGSPEALNAAIGLAGFGGRILIGSWYGEKRAALDLGGKFHRSRLKLISSQVSTIAPELTARWDKKRRFEAAWSAIRRLQPARWITHRFHLDEAGEAYRLLDEQPEQAIQVIFEYQE